MKPVKSISNSGFACILLFIILFSGCKDNQLIVYASDQAGAMHGGLEVAEQINIYGFDGIKETTQDPYMEMSGRNIIMHGVLALMRRLGI